MSLKFLKKYRKNLSKTHQKEIEKDQKLIIILKKLKTKDRKFRNKKNLKILVIFQKINKKKIVMIKVLDLIES